MDKQRNKGWFKMPKLQLWMSIIVLIFVVISVNSFTYKTVYNGTALINWLLAAIMFVCLVAMLIDNLSRGAKDEEKRIDETKDSTIEDTGGVAK